MNPGLAALWDEEIERRKIKNMNLENINPPTSQPRSHAVPTSSHVFYKTNLSKQLRECASEMVLVSISKCRFFRKNYLNSFFSCRCIREMYRYHFAK